MTMHIEMIMPSPSNLRVAEPEEPAEADPLGGARAGEKFSRCIGQATSVPIAMESSTAIWLMKPRKHQG